MDTQNANRAVELEQFLKGKIGSVPWHGLIKDISVSEGDNEKSLEVTIIPAYTSVTFGTLGISLNRADSEKGWRRKKKDVFGQVKGLRPEAAPRVMELLLQEAGGQLETWRAAHLFSRRMKDFLSSESASDYLSDGRIRSLKFLSGGEGLRSSDVEVTSEYISAKFEMAPVEALYDIRTGRVSVSLAEADTHYKKLMEALQNRQVQREIEAYLREQGISASVQYTGQPYVFTLTFVFDTGEETETVTIGEGYTKIIADAYHAARDRAERKKKELEEYLKICPAYGTFLAQAVLDTIEDNGECLTQGQVVNILRGTSLTDDYVYGRFSGKYYLIPKSEIGEVISTLERYKIIYMRRVQDENQEYNVCCVSLAGKIFGELQNTPVPGKDPVTEQEYYLTLRAVRDDIRLFTDQKKLEFLQVILDRPGIFLTDPDFILDCVEDMGTPAEEYLKELYWKETRWNRQSILRLLLNAAAGNGKNLPRNGLTAYREAEQVQKREREEAARRKKELFELVLTEIPDKYVDLYPAARSMKRHFVLHIGPANSGKTHDAVEELMRADSGVYLAPLRLLAYELYERINRAGCPCSLLTGEERYIIDGAMHQSSTIEMLNLEKQYDVAVIDEAQMISDRERGGAWTAAIMGVCASRIHICAAPEGEDRIIEIIKDCGDDYEIIRHRRMTPIVYEEKTFRFPEDVRPGDALIVFTRGNVHAVASQLKGRNVSCSIIYGALPYDVRHRQAELFANGTNEVVVATDAIGMGMNLPIRRVVMLETAKFDGFTRRSLYYAEIRQIVGRAGRYGIYDTGYAACANEEDIVQRALMGRLRPVKSAVIDFPETLLTVDAPILDLIKQWEEVVPAEGWQKESIVKMRRLARLTKDLEAPKRLAYDFLTVPFDDKNKKLLEIWQEIFEKEVRGEEYSIRDRVEAMDLEQPLTADAIDILEQEHKVLDLYFNLARKFQPFESTLDMIMDKKRICSDRITKILEKRGFKERFCSKCGKPLPWNNAKSTCADCLRKRRPFIHWK